MKLRSHPLFIIILIMCMPLLSCGNKKAQDNVANNVEEGSSEAFSINIVETHFSDNWNKLHRTEQTVSSTLFDSLNLESLSFMNWDVDYKIGEILIDEGNKKMLTIKAISGNEISEYLLTFINNEPIDSLLIAYEDAVEYYSTTSSVIEHNKIRVTTFNWVGFVASEVTDTIITNYTISNDLQFIEDIES